MGLRSATAVFLAVVSVPALAFDSLWLWRTGDSRYEVGDCITPTDQSLSFYGHYARVEGVIGFDGTEEDGVYALYFPVYVPRTPLYTQNIDDKTQRVSDDFCERQQVN